MSNQKPKKHAQTRSAITDKERARTMKIEHPSELLKTLFAKSGINIEFIDVVAKDE